MKFFSSKISINILTTLFLFNQGICAAEIIPDQYIIVFKDQNIQGQAKFSIAQTGETVAQAAERLINEVKQNELLIQNKGSNHIQVQSNRLDKVYENALKGFAARLTPEAVKLLRNKSEIDYILPDQVAELHAVQVPTSSWGLDRIDQRSLPLDQSYEYLADGSAVHAYVIDTGIRATHNEFSGRVGNGYDAIDNDNNPADCNGHGTHVAGTLAGKNYGVAKNVMIHAVRVFGCTGPSSNSTIIHGIDWVLANLQLPAVANMSFGSGADASIDIAVNNLINAGVTAVIAAGNDHGSSACTKSPARVTNAITVAASTISDQRSSFSNIGACVDIFAPGSSITSAWWNSNTATNTISGTSMSAPHVAGVAALYLQGSPTAATAEVANAIIGEASINKITDAGSGTPNRLLYSKLTNSLPPPEPELQLDWLVPVINLLLL